MKRLNSLLLCLLMALCFSSEVSAWKMEAGTIDLPSTFSQPGPFTVSLKQTYNTAPIIVALPTDNGGNASALRVEQVSDKDFMISHWEPRSEDGPHTDMTVSYVAVEPGEHTLPDGTVVEAGLLSSRPKTGDDFVQYKGSAPGNQRWGSHSFAGSFSGTPALVAAIQTANNETASSSDESSHPWLTTALDSVDASGFDYALERSEVFDQMNGSNFQFDDLASTEKIGYVAFDATANGQFPTFGNLVVDYEARFVGAAADGWDNGCDDTTFNTAFSNTPVVVATKNSRNEGDGGWLRECSVDSNAIGLTVDEDTAQDSERGHTDEDVGLLAFSQPFLFDSATSTGPPDQPFMLEAGTVDVTTGNSVSVSFEQSYPAAPAVFVLGDDNNSEPSSVRISQVTGSGFEVFAPEPPTGSSAESDSQTGVHYMAVTYGEHQFPDGTRLEVGQVPLLNVVGNNVGGSRWAPLGFNTGFSGTPALLSTIQTANNETSAPGGRSEPWMTVAHRDLDSNGVDIALDRAETSSGSVSSVEDTAFLAVETGEIDPFVDNEGNEVLSEARITSDSVAGTESCDTFGFVSGFSDPPLVVGAQVARDGNNGGWLRRCGVSSTEVDLKIEEDWADDRDLNHTTEQAAFMAFSQPFARDFSLESVVNFEVVAPGTASVCTPAVITIRARDADDNTVSNYSGTVDLTTSSGNGNWEIVTADGTLSPQPDNDDNGQAQYEFVNSDNGEIELGLGNERADDLTVTVEDTSGGQSGTSSVIQFQENAFVITEDDSLGDDFVAGRNHQLKVEAISRDTTDPSIDKCGTVTEYDGDIDLKGWIQRTGDDPGGASPKLDDGAGTDTMPDSEPANNNTTLAFNQGVASPQWLTSDVGQYALHLKDDSSGIVKNENDNPLTVTGSSQDWTVRPFGFHVSVVDNPGASGPTGSAFMAARRSFDVTTRAVVYDSADDSDDDGVPDNHGVADPSGNDDLSDNATTDAFGNGPNLSVELSSDLVANPPSPADPGLAGTTSVSGFNNGEATVSASYGEVGSISVKADLGGSYLGRSATVIGQTGFVGRFHPELFTAQPSDGSFAPECNGFVYSGQAHGYDAAPQIEITPRAHDASGTGPLVRNYREDWQFLTEGDVSRNFPTEDAGNGLNVTVGTADATLNPLGDGRMDYVFGEDEYTYVKDQNALIDPFPSDLVLEIDGIDDGDAQLEPSQNPVELNPAGVQIRYGRLRLDNTFGPETLNLIVPMRAEQWDGDSGRFELNTDESCWVYDTDADVTLDQAGLSGGSTSVLSVSDSLVAGELISGSELELTAPLEGNTGDVGVTFDVPVWLQDDFDGDGALDNPTATATFGVFRGHDRIIYWRERSE